MEGCGRYILVGKKPVLCNDIHVWANFFGDNARTVRKTEIGNKMVSTVFLGLDHNFMTDGPPILFETMIFSNDSFKVDDKDDGFQVRYSTWEEAEAGHERVCEKLKLKGGK